MPSTKIMLVGDSKVGKTAIQKRYCIAGQKVGKFFVALYHEIEVELRQLEQAEKGRPQSPPSVFGKIFGGSRDLRSSRPRSPPSVFGKIYGGSRDLCSKGCFDRKLNFLMNKFCGVHADYIDKMLDVFGHALLPVSIACFFAESGYAHKLQKLFPGLSQSFWLRCGVPLQQKREQSNQNFPPEIEAEFARFTQMMRKYQEGEYSALLTADLKLVSQDFCIVADEYVPTYVPTTNMKETVNGDVIVCDTPAVDDWQRFLGGFMQFGPMVDAIFLVYDIGNRDSFVRIQHYWHQLKEIFKINTDRDGVEDLTKEPMFVLMGNKCDLADEARQVSTEEGKSRAILFKMPFMEVSASKNINIESAFIQLVKAVKEKREEEKRKEIEAKMSEFFVGLGRVTVAALPLIQRIFQ